MGQSFGRRNRPAAAPVMPRKPAIEGRLQTGTRSAKALALKGCLAAVVVLALAWSLYEPRFPEGADRRTQCEYVVAHQRTSTALHKSACTDAPARETYISGYKIWKTYGTDSDFPYFLSPELRCHHVMTWLNLASLKRMGRLFISEKMAASECLNPEKHAQYIDVYFKWARDGHFR